jgi:hypothetical protein
MKLIRFKSYIVPTLLINLLLNCNSPDKKNENPEVVIEDTVIDKSPSFSEDSVIYVNNQALLWHVDDSNGLKLQKPKKPGIDTMSARNLIKMLNNNYDSIYLGYIKTSHDTIYVHIPHSEKLTERIGSTGAEIYMASTTYSLTELTNIKYVNYDFEEGEHASPGVYSRDNFRGFNNNAP